MAIPFEEFKDVLAITVDISSLLNQHEVEDRNFMQRVIAVLALRGFINFIVTTNFDCNIERAL